ncbi:hypothetical protein MRB53_040488 [Persea americana]|nr:hypothetical protein MRB53_040488 [Persea americana]
MAKGLGLKDALNRYKGVNHKVERQKKLQKQAARSKRQKQEGENDEEDLEDILDVNDSEVDGDDGLQLVESKKTKKQRHGTAKTAADEVEDWNTDDSDAEDDDVEGGITLGEIEDESDSDSDEEIDFSAMSNQHAKTNGHAAAGADDDEEEEDVPFSDIESLASEERADIVPHQRLTINNTAALLRSLKSFALSTDLPFSAVQSVTSAEPVVIADVDDDLNRELAFYRQSLDAVTEGRSRLKKEGVPFSRPTDYFAEMAKSEEQMGKIKQKLVDEAARKKASADARRQRDLKKFGKAVQVAKLQERQKEKRDTLDRINTLKRNLTANEDDMFDVALESAADTAKSDRAARKSRAGTDGPNHKRQKKDSKFGFGGKKRFAKSNDAKSASDLSGYSVKKMKSGSGRPAKARPGKSKRARMN